MRVFLTAILSLVITACATTGYDAAKFQSRVNEIGTLATTQGVSQEVIRQHLNPAEYLPVVIERDRNQPEFKLGFAEYRDRIVSPTRVAHGQKFLAANRNALAQVAKTTGVDPSIIVALWGIETNFGQIKGGYNVIDALATLAYDGRRSKYFEGELIQALKLIDQNPNLPTPLMGSWAGAMGQFQFMPSSYNRFALDGDNDNLADLWRDSVDGFASAGNYLQKSGWQPGLRYGDKVQLPMPEVPPEWIGLDVQKTVAEWQKLGFVSQSGFALPKGSTKASLLVMDDDGMAFLVYNNYQCLLKWNRSHNFALTVGLLADRIAMTANANKNNS